MLLLLAVVTAAPSAHGADPPAAVRSKTAADDDSYPRETLVDSGGAKVSLADSRGRVATVLVCMATDCPISTDYVPELNRLAAKYRPLGIQWIGLNPNAHQALAEMTAYAREVKLAFPFVLDAEGKISRRFRFQVTPEVCVFDAAGQLVYRGRIDDRYRAGAAGIAMRADLERALDEIIAGKPVSSSRTKAVGCPVIVSPAGAKRGAE
jgi:peroxiredoxin